MLKQITCSTTKKGYPAIWEEGGAATNTGDARIICNPDGSPKHPVYVRRNGHLANGQHALFVARPRDIVIQANHHRGDFIIHIFEVSSIEERDGHDRAMLKLVSEFSRGEWSEDVVSRRLSEGLKAAKEKAQCYHCRHSHYLMEEEAAVVNG